MGCSRTASPLSQSRFLYAPFTARRAIALRGLGLRAFGPPGSPGNFTSRRAVYAAQAWQAKFHRVLQPGGCPKKTPLSRGVGRLLVCGGVSFSLLSGVRGIRPAGRLLPDPHFLSVVPVSSSFPAFADDGYRRATLVPTGTGGAVSPSGTLRRRCKCDAVHVVGTKCHRSRAAESTVDGVMSAF